MTDDSLCLFDETGAPNASLFDVDAVAPAEETTVGWLGVASLRDYLVPLGELATNGADPGDVDVDAIAAGLREHGQLRPVLVDENRAPVENAHLVPAAAALGWTHIAVRVFEEEPADQMTFVDEVERKAPEEFALMRSLARAERLSRTEEEEVEAVNAASADPNARWVGLPAFAPAATEWKLVVSCETEEIRDALLDVLGISTIHKGTRGTLSTWWPDRARKDLASLRFVAEDVD